MRGLLGFYVTAMMMIRIVAFLSNRMSTSAILTIAIAIAVHPDR